MNKTKLKTLNEYYEKTWDYKCPDCGMGIGARNRENKCNTHHSIYDNPLFIAMEEMLNAHHEAILSLQKEVEALSSQLNALQTLRNLEAGLRNSSKLIN